ncbi:MAG: alpha/beta fold hydrolase [Chloroflexi bacterium]|nr:alpha/beta fold hydrolase [Chloroflexota bacterium]
MLPSDRPDRLALPFAILSNAAGIAEQYGQRTLSQVIYRENKMRVLHYQPRVPRPYPIPLVMTAPIIMPHYIMDLRPGKSLVEYLVARGLDVFMIDWGVAAEADRFDTLDDYVVRYLKHAVQAVCQMTHASQVTLHGYCQGGLLAILFAALYPQRVRNLVSQTGPVNFHDDGIFSLWTRQLNVDLLVDTLGNIPGEMLRASFQMVNPTGALAQTLRYCERVADEEYVRDYVALNTWLNDVVPLPGELFRQFIKDLYQRNLLVQGQFEIAGTRVDLRQITCPVLTLTSEKDHVVPWKSAAVLNDLVSSRDKQLLVLKGGHLGMTIGRDAWNELWPALAHWLIQRSTEERNSRDA